MQIIFRGTVGTEYYDYVLKEWAELKMQENYKKVRNKLKGTEPRLFRAKSCDLIIISSERREWIRFLERKYLNIVKPNYSYVIDKTLKDIYNPVFPFYLASLRYFYSASNKITKKMITDFLNSEFCISDANTLVEYLINNDVLKLIYEDYVEISPINKLCPPYAKIETIVDNSKVGNKNISRTIMDKMGAHPSHQQQIYYLLSRTNTLIKEIKENPKSLIRNWLEYEDKIFSLVHSMLDYYLYTEADQLLNQCKESIFPHKPTGKEIEKAKLDFDMQRNKSWGLRFCEISMENGLGTTATVLPEIISYLENGFLKQFSVNGSYRLLPGVPKIDSII